jgi:hypothetical protein
MSRNVKDYPEFTVPAKEVRGSDGKVQQTTLDFSKKTFQERVGQIELKKDGEIKQTEEISEFWERLKTLNIGKREKSEVKFRPELRGVNGKFISTAEQETVIRRFENKTGKNFNKLNKTQRTKSFKKEIRSSREDTISQDIDRLSVANSVEQKFNANPDYILEIKGSDGKARTYTNKQTGVDALNQQLNRFYQSVGKNKKGRN